MLDNLTQRLTGVIKTLRGQARLTEDNIQDALREVDHQEEGNLQDHESDNRHAIVAHLQQCGQRSAEDQHGDTAQKAGAGQEAGVSVYFRGRVLSGLRRYA